MTRHGWTTVAAGLTMSMLACVNESKTPVLGACGEGQFVKKTGDGWACTTLGDGGVDASKTPIVEACQAGQAVRRNAIGWECFTPAGGEGIDPARTPVVGTCAEGQVVQRTADGWSCVTVDIVGLVARLEAAEAKLSRVGFIQAPPAAEAGTYRLSGDGVWSRESVESHTAVFDSDGSFTVPDGVRGVLVELWSGGSGGTGVSYAANSYSPRSATGGKGGAYVRGGVPVTPGQTIPVIVGRGGAAGATGTPSYFGSYLATAKGSDTNSAGGSLGPISLFAQGSPGTTGSCFNLPPYICLGGMGGVAGGRGGGSDTAPGGGGSASSASFGTAQSVQSNGNPGADGRVVVSW